MKHRIAAAALAGLLLVAGDAFRAAAQNGDSTPTLTLETLMRGTGLEHRRTQHGHFNVFFKAEAAEGIEGWAIVVRYNNPTSKDYVMVYCTMIDRPDGHRFPAAAVAAALVYNSKNLGARPGN